MSGQTFRFLGVITARSGSKGIKGKNIKRLNGKPLLAYTMLAAKKSKLLTETIVSTDANSFKRVAESYGGYVPFLRPAYLAKDKTPTVPVLRHALVEYEKLTGVRFDYVVLLQPTSPLRLASDIDEAIHLILEHPSADNLVSCYKAENIHPKKMYTFKRGKACHYLPGDDGMFRRQDVEEIYIRNGSVYIIRRDLLFKNKMFGKHPVIMVMPKLRSVDIDTLADFKLTELILKNFNLAALS